LADKQDPSTRLDRILRKIYTVQENDIGCDDCYTEIDQYVELLRAGKDVASILPEVKAHLSQCQCCEVEFKALISILEASEKDS